MRQPGRSTEPPCPSLSASRTSATRSASVTTSKRPGYHGRDRGTPAAGAGAVAHCARETLRSTRRGWFLIQERIPRELTSPLAFGQQRPVGADLVLHSHALPPGELRRARVGTVVHEIVDRIITWKRATSVPRLAPVRWPPLERRISHHVTRLAAAVRLRRKGMQQAGPMADLVNYCVALVVEPGSCPPAASNSAP